MSMQQLVEIMERLRDPDSGCPWDRAQTLRSVVPYTIEEAYEVADSIARGNMADLCDELGDLLFQVVFYARIAQELGEFELSDVTRAICDKMIRRHPHVFADAQVVDAIDQTVAWEKLKEEERASRAGGATNRHLDGIARGLPALIRAGKLQRRAAKVGFDWSERTAVLAKVREELDELEAELAESDVSEKRLADEMGDVLFSCVNLSRHLGLDAETLLRQANDKFEDRFNRMETLLSREGKNLKQVDLPELDAAWNRVKEREATT